MQKALITKSTLPLVPAVTLFRYHCEPNPDSVASPHQIGLRLLQVSQRLLPAVVKPFFAGLQLHFRDMDDPELDAEIARRQANLQEFNLATPEPDTAAGLYWGKRGSQTLNEYFFKLDVAVFHNGWRHDVQPSVQPIQESNRQSALKVLPHELGHHLAALIGFMHGQIFIEKELTRLILALLPGQASTPGEDFAEVFHAGFGDNNAFGFFSDRKAYTLPPKLRLILTVCLLLHERLKAKVFTDLTLDEQVVSWSEWGHVTRFFLNIPWFPYTSWEVTGRYTMDINGLITKKA